MGGKTSSDSTKWALSVTAFKGAGLSSKKIIGPAPAGCLMGFTLKNLSTGKEREFVFYGAGIGRDVGAPTLSDVKKFIPSLKGTTDKWITFETEEPYTFEDFSGRARLGRISFGTFGEDANLNFLLAFITFSNIDIAQSVWSGEEIRISDFPQLSSTAGASYYPIGYVRALVPTSSALVPSEDTAELQVGNFDLNVAKAQECQSTLVRNPSANLTDMSITEQSLWSPHTQASSEEMAHEGNVHLERTVPNTIDNLKEALETSYEELSQPMQLQDLLREQLNSCENKSEVSQSGHQQIYEKQGNAFLNPDNSLLNRDNSFLSSGANAVADGGQLQEFDDLHLPDQSSIDSDAQEALPTAAENAKNHRSGK